MELGWNEREEDLQDERRMEKESGEGAMYQLLDTLPFLSMNTPPSASRFTMCSLRGSNIVPIQFS